LERGQGVEGIELIALGRPELDLECPGSVAQAVARAAPDVVVSAAAYTAVDQAEDEPERAFRVNGEAPGELAAAARKVGAPIIHLSTDYVFDGEAGEPYSEDAPPNPIGVYGRSKLFGEERVRAANRDHVVVRTAWVYSPFGKNFLKTMMTLARERDELRVVADQQGNPSSALDIADGILTVLQSWRGGHRAGLGRTFHLAGTGEATWFAFANEILRSSAAARASTPRLVPVLTKDWPTRAARPRNSRLDCTRFRETFGFSMPEWTSSTRDVVAQLMGNVSSTR
jgi:dTDP-4-dehydrorhamnose reductase